MCNIRGFQLVSALIVCLALSSTASGRPKTPKEQAAAHFRKGQAHFQAKRFLEAVRELKMAYNIRSAPDVLLFIGRTWQTAGMKEEAVIWFRRYLDESRLTYVVKRKQARQAILALGGKLKVCNCPVAVAKPRSAVTRKKPPKPKRRFTHEVVEEARPNRPLLVDAELSKGFGFARIYVYYRTAGMGHFIKRKMKRGRRGIYQHLIHRTCLRGKSMQYFIEVIGRTGRRVAGSGKATSPNIVLLTRRAGMQSGGRMNDTGQTACVPRRR